MWYGGWESKGEFYRNVAITESLLKEIDKSMTFKEILEYIQAMDMIYMFPPRLAACTRSYIKNGKPICFSDNYEQNYSTTN